MRFLRRIFVRDRRRSESPEAYGLSTLDPEELEKIGTDEDPLRFYDTAFDRNLEAMEAEQRGDVERAISLYERSVDEEFVGAHPYERLSSIYERRRDYGAALRVCEAFVRLAGSGKLPRGAQRSAERRLPDFEFRARRLRNLLKG